MLFLGYWPKNKKFFEHVENISFQFHQVSWDNNERRKIMDTLRALSQYENSNLLHRFW